MLGKRQLLVANRIAIVQKEHKNGFLTIILNYRAKIAILSAPGDRKDDSYQAWAFQSKPLFNFSLFCTLNGNFSVSCFSQISMEFCHDFSKSIKDIFLKFSGEILYTIMKITDYNQVPSFKLSFIKSHLLS